jgi:NAD(P)-dependent dehydrogenase (short-subunit alcohol dehydrogenase family)
MSAEDRPAMTILVTGAASGIGAATARLAARRGHRVIAFDNDAAVVERLADELQAAGAADVIAAAVDVSDERQVEDALDEAQAALGIPTGAVCCAGIDRGGVTHELPVENFDRIISVNLRGTFITCRSVIGRLVNAERGGALVCVSSISAFAGVPGGTAAYSASKGGVTGMVRSLAVEYAPHGIRVNALAPGATETPLMWANVTAEEEKAMRQTILEEVPLGRLADPVEQGRAALWLLSDEAAYMTGQHLVLDGGTLALAALSI